MVVMFYLFFNFILGSIMANNITKTENKYMCKREHCTVSFKYTSVCPQMFSHLQDGSYQCVKCRMGIHRHVKNWQMLREI